MLETYVNHLTVKEFELLVDKTPNINKELVLKALHHADIVHKDKKRDSGNSYIEEHVLPITNSVIQIINENKQATDIIIASLLHDAIEDDINTDWNRLKIEYSQSVADWVLKLSKKSQKNPFHDFFLYEPIRDCFFNIAIKNAVWQVKLIKLMDRYNNLFSSYVLLSTGKRIDKAKLFINESIKVHLPIAQSLDSEIGTNTYDDLVELITKMQVRLKTFEIK